MIEYTSDKYEQTKLGGIKDSKGKPKLHLLPCLPLIAFCRIREYGLYKYPDADNWRKVPIEDWTDACLRHLMAWNSGEKLDKESGYPHLWHALTNLFFMICLEAGNENDQGEQIHN